MSDRSIVSLMAAGLRAKGSDVITSFGGRASEISGVGFPREPFAGAWQRNISCEGPGTLLSFSPIYACVTRIASDIAKLSLGLKMKDERGITVDAPKNSPYAAILRKQNSYQNRIQFFRYWLLCKLLFGNAYAIKFRDLRGIVTSLYLVDPRKVTPLVTPDGGVYYSISGDDLARMPTGYAAAPASEVIHDRGPTLWHPLVGVPPLYAAALSGTLGLQIQRNSAAFFSNMSRPSGMLSGPGVINEVTAERLKKEWETNYRAGNIGRTAVLGDGLKYESMAIAAEASQLAEQLGLTAIDVATAHGMPAYKINQGPMPTNNNVGALNQQYYSDCLQVHIEDIELCLDEGLGLPDGYSTRFDLNGLLRTDPASLYTALGVAVDKTLMTPDEAREELDLPPVEGGDTLYKQEQNYSLAALAKRDAREDPFAKGSPEPAPVVTPEPDDSSKEAAAAFRAAAESMRGTADALGEIRQFAAQHDAGAAASAVAAVHVFSEEIKADREAARAAHVEVLDVIRNMLTVREAAAPAPEPALIAEEGDETLQLMSVIVPQLQALEINLV